MDKGGFSSSQSMGSIGGRLDSGFGSDFGISSGNNNFGSGSGFGLTSDVDSFSTKSKGWCFLFIYIGYLSNLVII